jgi:pyruvate/2-oxoglutarate dehydrogenase complex dihydrolipoamide dehydrogenase (E3) component
VSALTVPWCTYTTPEVAHVGLYEREARERGIDVTTLTLPLHDVDRARLEGDDDGFLRLHVRKGKGTIVGATLVAPHAGETISEVSVAMAARLGLGAIANVIHPYPTAAEVIRKAGDVWNRGRLTPGVQRLFSWWFSVRR